MKKILTLLMAIIMITSMAACGNAKENTSSQNISSNNSSSEEASSNDAATDLTVGETLLADFKSDSKGTPQEIADRLIKNPIIQFMGGATPIEEGLLSGFDNTEIKGFKEGAMFAPMMSSIAFVGYVFELPEDADVDMFKTTLKNSANLRWNICVEAEELIIENEGKKVFFLMCPKSFEQPETDGSIAQDDMIADDMIPAEDGETVQ